MAKKRLGLTARSRSSAEGALREEAVIVGAASNLNKADYIVRSPASALADLLRGQSLQHLVASSQAQDRCFPGPQLQIGIAVGFALAFHNQGQPHVALVLGGIDLALETGLAEALGFSSAHKL
ncbi:MAG TPA: hypothetical protein VFL42_03715, partial [Terriglobales bacterium]|nr:hypothetical protein [Terriglobales bacterium]